MHCTLCQMSEGASDAYFTLRQPFDQYHYNQHVSSIAHMACLKLFEYKKGNKRRQPEEIKQTGIYNFFTKKRVSELNEEVCTAEQAFYAV